MKAVWRVRLSAVLCALVIAAAGASALARQSATAQGRSVTLRVEPTIPTGLGDRVLGPVTLAVEASGAAWVVVYLRATDMPYGGCALGPPIRIAEGPVVDGRARLPWTAEAEHDSVELTALALGPPGSSLIAYSQPVPLLLDWQRRAGGESGDADRIPDCAIHART